MTSEPARRRWRITGTDATLSADLLTSTISLEPHGKDRYVVATIEPGERDRAEERLIRHLIELSDGDVRPDCTLADGIAALEIVDAARRSADSSAPAAVNRCDRSDS